MNFDLVNLLIESLEVSIDFSTCLLLNAYYSVLVALALTVHIVLWVNLQIVQWIKRVQSLIIPMVVFETPGFFYTQAQYIHSCPTESDELFADLQQETWNVAFPELKCLMLINSLSTFMNDCSKIEHNCIVSINVNCFVSTNKLFEWLLLFSISTTKEDVGVTYAQIMPPGGQDCVIFRVTFWKFVEVESYKPISLVAEKIKCLILPVIKDWFDALNSVKLIEIYDSVSREAIVISLVLCSNNKIIL